MINPVATMIDMTEKLANDSKLPSRITDWASTMYDTLTTDSAVLCVDDLQVLGTLVEDQEHGLYQLDRHLTATA